MGNVSVIEAPQTAKEMIDPDAIGGPLGSVVSHDVVPHSQAPFVQIHVFAEKVVLGLDADSAIPELGLTPVEFGFIGSTFFLLFAIVSFATAIIASTCR